MLPEDSTKSCLQGRVVFSAQLASWSLLSACAVCNHKHFNTLHCTKTQACPPSPSLHAGSSSSSTRWTRSAARCRTTLRSSLSSSQTFCMLAPRHTSNPLDGKRGSLPNHPEFLAQLQQDFSSNREVPQASFHSEQPDQQYLVHSHSQSHPFTDHLLDVFSPRGLPIQESRQLMLTSHSSLPEPIASPRLERLLSTPR